MSDFCSLETFQWHLKGESYMAYLQNKIDSSLDEIQLN